MVATVEKLPGKSVVIIALDDREDLSALLDAYALSVDMAATCTAPVTRVVDLRQAPRSYQKLVTALEDIVRGIAGASTAPVLDMAFVVRPEMASFFASRGLFAASSLDEAVAMGQTAQMPVPISA